MSTIPQVSEAMRWVLEDYPRQIERETNFVQRTSAQLDGARFVQCLVFAWMADPDASYTKLRHVAATLSVSVSNQAVEQRFSDASALLLKRVLQQAGLQLICSQGQIPEVVSRFAGVWVQDGSVVSLPEGLAQQYPGCGGSTIEAGRSQLRMQVRWELGHGQMLGPCLQPGRAAERSGEAMQTPMPSGSLLIVDSGSFTLPEMRKRGHDGQFWITPAKLHLCLSDRTGIKWDLESFLKAHPDGEPIDEWVHLGKQERLPARLIAVKFSGEQGQKKRERACARSSMPSHRKGAQHCGPRRGKKQERVKKKSNSRQKSKRISATRLRLADWTILITNVAAQQLSVDEVLMRMRGPGGIVVEIVEAIWQNRYRAP